MSELVTKYEFKAANEHELSFAKGERLSVVSRETANWWRCRNATGASGMVPSNYVEVVQEQRTSARSSRRLSLSAGALFDTADLIAKVERTDDDVRASVEPRGAKDRKWMVKSVAEFAAFDKQIRLVADDDGLLALSSVPALSERAVAKALKTRDAAGLEKWLQALVDTPSLRALAIAFVSGGRVSGDAELLGEEKSSGAEESKRRPSSEEEDEEEEEESPIPHKLLAATALHHFVPSSESELALDEGDVVEIAVSESANLDDPEGVIKAEATDGWLLGRSERTRDVGYFPALYVKPKTATSSKKTTASSDKKVSSDKAEKKSSPKDAAAEGDKKKKKKQAQVKEEKRPTSSRSSRPCSMRSLMAFDALTSKGLAVEPQADNSGNDKLPAAAKGDVVRLRCTASSWDGGSGLSTPYASTEWDDQDELTLKVGDAEAATDGLHRALEGLRAGDAVRVTCAPKLAYGDAGLPGSVPQGSFLIYDVVVLEVSSPAAYSGPAPPRGPLPLLARPARTLDEQDRGQHLGRVVSSRKRLTLNAGGQVRRQLVNALPTHHEIDEQAAAAVVA